MKKKQRISDLFYDNRFLMVFSVVVAVVFWLVVVVEFGVEVEKEIKGVTVTVDYDRIENDLGLQPFGQKNFTVDVTVSGKKYIVDADDIADEIIVKANTSYVNTAGNNTLRLSVTSDNSLYDIVSVSPDDEITVYFDYPGEKEVVVEPEIVFDGEPVADGYYMGEYIFPESNTVRVTGPESEINKISKVVARANVDGKLRESKTVEAELVAISANGDTIPYVTFNRQSNVTSVTLPVYKLATLPVSCSFVNRPSDYVDNTNLPFVYTVSPSSVEAGVPAKKLESAGTLEIMTIDFSELKSGVNTFKVKASELTNAVIVDGTEEFTVTVTVTGMASKTVKPNQDVSFINAPEGVTYELLSLDFSELEFIGPAESLKTLNSDNVVLTVDLSDVSPDETGNIVVPVTVTDNDCWLFGTYTATVLIS